MPFKIYEVELKRVRYVTYTVEALDENHAEEIAWDLLKKDEAGQWEVNFVWEAEI